MKTIVQSQVVYSVGVILNLAANVAHSNLALLTSAILPPLLVRPHNNILCRLALRVLTCGSGHLVHPDHHSNWDQRDARGGIRRTKLDGERHAARRTRAGVVAHRGQHVYHADGRQSGCGRAL